MKKKFGDYVISVVTDTNDTYKGRAYVLKAFLFVLSRIFRLIVSIRGRLYRAKIFRQKNFGCVIISVGNITVGGTGKTPVVEMLAAKLSEEGRRVGVLTRGYKSKAQKGGLDSFLRFFGVSRNPVKIVSVGDGPLLEPQVAGDEAYMLATNLKGVSIFSCKNRVRAAQDAIEKHGMDTLILDDGFQYLKLGRKLDIVLIDSLNPFGNEHLLPRGILREPLSKLKRAHCFFLTKADKTSTSGLKQMLRETNSSAAIIECAHFPEYVIDRFSNTRRNLDYLQGKKVYVFSGIASPEGFEKSVRELGAQISGTERYTDHHHFSARELRAIVKRGARSGAQFVITTEKDAARIPRNFKSSIPIFCLRVRIEIISGREVFNDLLSRVCFY